MRAHRTTARPGTAERFEQPKILIRDTGSGLQGTFDERKYYAKDVLIISDSSKEAKKLMALTGLLNSRLMRFYYETSFPTLHVQRDELASLPIRLTNFADSENEAKPNRLANLVEQMLTLREERAQIKRTWREWVETVLYQQHALTGEFLKEGWVEVGLRGGWSGIRAELQNRGAVPSAKILQDLRRETEDALSKLKPLYERIEATDRLIDQIVYRLYGLTEAEIAVVEESVKGA